MKIVDLSPVTLTKPQTTVADNDYPGQRSTCINETGLVPPNVCVAIRMTSPNVLVDGARSSCETDSCVAILLRHWRK